jgi:molybdenum cofactor synthesis domain-containing protein
MVLEARRLVDGSGRSDLPVDALNALGYDEAAQHVYGMKYEDWKKRHQKKATDEQMERYKASEPIQAKHDKDLLATRANKPKVRTANKEEAAATNATAVLSNVCCQDVEQVVAANKETSAVKHSRTVGPFQPPPIPTNFVRPPAIAILTVSDRAAADGYETGDLSGPAVAAAVCSITKQPQDSFVTAIVPDDSAAIQAKLKTWCNSDNAIVDLVLTTGGTGFGPRDITPEATAEVVDYEIPNLMAFCVTESSHLQPLSSLSRGTAGILNNTVIANLPGNPKAVGEILPLLLPLLLHAVADLQNINETPEVLHIG